MKWVVAIAAVAWWWWWWWCCFTARSPIDPLPTWLPWPPPRRTALLAPNSHLHHLHKLGAGLVPGPEDLAFDALHHRLYAACADGWVKTISLPDGRVHNWTKIDGRPLGLVIGLHAEILVCEPSLGLLNVTRGSVTVLSDGACGVKFKFADGIDIAKDGSIYFTDASSKFGYGDSDLDVLEGRPNGRLLKYDPATRETSVLATNLFFPNGVAVSADQSFLVFCETAKVRCQRYWLSGERKGTREIFIDNLLGYPDNIRASKRGTFWIALVSGRSLWTELVLRVPMVKHFYATPRGLRTLNVAPYMAKVLEVSEDGKPISFHEDPNGAAIGFVTTALEVGDALYVGGLVSDYIGKLKLHST